MEKTSTKIRASHESNSKIESHRILAQSKKQIKYLAYINGPILFTAPHSCRLYRGGPDYRRKETIHSREKYTSILAMRWAIQSKNSFCV